MKTYSWDGLLTATSNQLDDIKKELQNELHEIRKEKFVKIQNILCLQEMIKNESGTE